MHDINNDAPKSSLSQNVEEDLESFIRAMIWTDAVSHGVATVGLILLFWWWLWHCR